MPSRTNVNAATISKPMMLQKTGDARDANFPVDAEGRTYHLGAKRGDIANRILCVGDPRRAERIAMMFDEADKVWRRASTRGFVIYTGRKQNVPLSIIAIGMGMPMMDFFVREARAVIDGPMVVVRFGTCGSLIKELPIGGIAVHSKGAVSVLRNPDAFRRPHAVAPAAAPAAAAFSAQNNPALAQAGASATAGSSDGSGYPHHHAHHHSAPQPYLISQPVLPHAGLSRELSQMIHQRLEGRVQEVMDATADSFYSSQGRLDGRFPDQNSDLFTLLHQMQPQVGTLEMETFHLFDMADMCKEPMRAASCCIVLANRLNNAFLDNKTIAELESTVGRAVMQTLVQHELPPQSCMDDDDCVWNQDPKQWQGTTASESH
jgi:uridine phosphorylase